MEIFRNIMTATEEENFYYFFEHLYAVQFHARRIIAANSIEFNEELGEQTYTYDIYVTQSSIRNYFDTIIEVHFPSIEYSEKVKSILPEFIPQVESFIDYTKLMKVSIDKDHFPHYDSIEVADYARVVLAKAMMPKSNDKESPLEWYDRYEINSSYFEKLLYDAYYFLDFNPDSKFQKPSFTLSFGLRVMLHLHLTGLLYIQELHKFNELSEGVDIVNQN